MPNYQNGKIYKIINDIDDKIYIGSTTLLLCQRLAGHHQHCSTSAKQFFNVNHKIILLENYACNSKEELESRERYYIELNKDICVNKMIPTRTKKEYYQDNKELINKQQREKIECVCGSSYTRSNKNKHIISKKHLAFIN